MTRSPAPAPDRLEVPGRWASGQSFRLELSDALALELVRTGVATGPLAVQLGDTLARVALRVIASQLLATTGSDR